MCQLVSLFSLDKLTKFLELKLVGLYRDDVSAVMQNGSGHANEKLRKEVVKILKRDRIFAARDLFSVDNLFKKWDIFAIVLVEKFDESIW